MESTLQSVHLTKFFLTRFMFSMKAAFPNLSFAAPKDADIKARVPRYLTH